MDEHLEQGRLRSGEMVGTPSTPRPPQAGTPNSTTTSITNPGTTAVGARQLCRDNTTPRLLDLPAIPAEFTLTGHCSFFDTINMLPMPAPSMFTQQTADTFLDANGQPRGLTGKILFSGNLEAGIATEDATSNMACRAARQTNFANLKRLRCTLPNDIKFRHPKQDSDGTITCMTDPVTKQLNNRMIEEQRQDRLRSGKTAEVRAPLKVFHEKLTRRRAAKPKKEVPETAEKTKPAAQVTSETTKTSETAQNSRPTENLQNSQDSHVQQYVNQQSAYIAQTSPPYENNDPFYNTQGGLVNGPSGGQKSKQGVLQAATRISPTPSSQANIIRSKVKMESVLDDIAASTSSSTENTPHSTPSGTPVKQPAPRVNSPLASHRACELPDPATLVPAMYKPDTAILPGTKIIKNIPRQQKSKPIKLNYARVQFEEDQEELIINDVNDIWRWNKSKGTRNKVEDLADLKQGDSVIARWPANRRWYMATVVDPLGTRKGKKKAGQKSSSMPMTREVGIDGLPVVKREFVETSTNKSPKGKKAEEALERTTTDELMQQSINAKIKQRLDRLKEAKQPPKPESSSPEQGQQVPVQQPQQSTGSSGTSTVSAAEALAQAAAGHPHSIPETHHSQQPHQHIHETALPLTSVPTATMHLSQPPIQQTGSSPQQILDEAVRQQVQMKASQDILQKAAAQFTQNELPDTSSLLTSNMGLDATAPLPQIGMDDLGSINDPLPKPAFGQGAFGDGQATRAIDSPRKPSGEMDTTEDGLPAVLPDAGLAEPPSLSPFAAEPPPIPTLDAVALEPVSTAPALLPADLGAQPSENADEFASRSDAAPAVVDESTNFSRSSLDVKKEAVEAEVQRDSLAEDSCGGAHSEVGAAVEPASVNSATEAEIAGSAREAVAPTIKTEAIHEDIPKPETDNQVGTSAVAALETPKVDTNSADVESSANPPAAPEPPQPEKPKLPPLIPVYDDDCEFQDAMSSPGSDFIPAPNRGDSPVRDTPIRFTNEARAISPKPVEPKTVGRGRRLIETKKVLTKKYTTKVYNDIGELTVESKQDLIEFNALVEEAIEPLDSIDPTELISHDETEGTDLETFEIPPNCILPTTILSKLKRHSLKLQKMEILHKVNIENVCKLMTLFELNIRNGLAAGKQCVHVAKNREILLVVEGAMLSASIALIILAARKMSIEVFNHELLERCADILKDQLSQTIYPQLDTIYAKAAAKEKSAAITGKRGVWRGAFHKKIVKLYNHACEILQQLAILVTRSLIYNHEQFMIKVTSISVSVYFVENVPELQYAALGLACEIFVHSGKQNRDSLVDEFFVQLNHLPQAKRTKRQFKLRRYGTSHGDDDDAGSENGSAHSDEQEKRDDYQEDSQHIQMFSALMMLFVQSSVEACKIKKEVHNDEFVINSYRDSKYVAQRFLVKLLQKRKEKVEDFDYKQLFDDVVQDLLTCVNRPEWPGAEMLLTLLGRLLSEYFTQKNIDANLRVGALDCLGSVARKLREDQIQAEDLGMSGKFESLIEGILKQLGEAKMSGLEQLGQHWKNVLTNEGEDTKKCKRRRLSGAGQGLCQLFDTLLIEKPPELDANNNKTISDSKFKVPELPKPLKKKHKKNKRSKTFPDPAPSKEFYCKVEESDEQKLISRLQTVILQHLRYNTKADVLLQYAINFYVGQWLDTLKTSEDQLNQDADEEFTPDGERMTHSQTERLSSDKRYQIRKLLDIFRERIRVNALSMKKKSKKKRKTVNIVVELKYDDAECVIKFLASKRHLAQSFDTYLTQILRILGETTVTVRSRGLKALSDVVEVDPNILTRHEVWAAVQARLNDQATQVREAAVELLGTFILGRPDIIKEYYQQIANRIGDTGLSVRKRVIKILRDLILMTRRDSEVEFAQAADACMRILICINDEDGVKKLVQETFYQLWFSPVEIYRGMKNDEITQHTSHIINTRALEITETVVRLLDEERDGFLEALLDSLMSEQILKSEEIRKVDDIKDRRDDTRKICQNICDALGEKLDTSEAENIFDVGELAGKKGLNNRIVATFYTLSVFCRYDPRFLQENVFNIPPYLKVEVGPACTMADTYIVVSAATILEKTIPYLSRPGSEFSNSIQTSCAEILLRAVKPGIISSVVNLLKIVTIHLTRRYEFVWNLFYRFFGLLTKYNKRAGEFNKKEMLVTKRLVVVLGHFARAFNLNSDKYKPKRLKNIDITQKIFELMISFINNPSLRSIRVDIVTAIGQILLRDPVKMVSDVEIQALYESTMETPWSDADTEATRIQVLHNLKEFLEDEDNKMMKFKEAEKVKQDAGKTIDGEKSDEYDIRCLNDVSASQGAAVMQRYLKSVEHCLLHGTRSARKAALDVVYLISFGGLVHPQSCIPLLMASSTDSCEKIRQKADSQLAKSQTNLLLSTALKGISLAYELCKSESNQAVARSGEDHMVRGFRAIQSDTGEWQTTPLCGFVYMQMRANKRQRRSLLNCYLNAFNASGSGGKDKSSIPGPDEIAKLLYIVDTLATLPYATQDEPLWLLNAIDVNLSVSGSAVLERFRSTCIRPYKTNSETQPESTKPPTKDEEEGQTATLNPDGTTMQEGSDEDANPKSAPPPPEATAHEFEEPELGDQDSYHRLEEWLSRDEIKLNTFYHKLLACFLLHALKSHMRLAYAISDRKIQEYIRISSVSESLQQEGENADANKDNGEPKRDEYEGMDPAEVKKLKKAKAKAAKQKKQESIKVFDRLVTRRHGVDFDKQHCLRLVKDYLRNHQKYQFTELAPRLEIIHQYTIFRQLLEQIDRHGSDDEECDEQDILEHLRHDSGGAVGSARETPTAEVGKEVESNADVKDETLPRIKEEALEEVEDDEQPARRSGRRLIVTTDEASKPKIGRRLIVTPQSSSSNQKDLNQNKIATTTPKASKPHKSKKKNKKKRKRSHDSDDYSDDDDAGDELFRPDNYTKPVRSY